MKPHLHLHVGLGKCASTSLQSYLAQHRSALRDHGVDYPDLGTGQAGNATAYALSLRPKRARWGQRQFDFASARDRLANAMQTCSADRILLSSEALTHPDHPVDLAWLFDLSASVTVHLIVRPRAALLVSAYAQFVRASGLHEDLPTFLDSPLVQAGASFSDTLARWQTRVGKDAVRLYCLRDGGPPIITQVVQSVAPAAKALPPPGPRQNRAPSAFVLVAAAHAQHPRHGAKLPPLGTILATAAAHDPDPSMTLLTGDIAARIDTQFAQDTTRFVAMQDGVRRADIETDPGSIGTHAVSEADVRALPAFRACLDALGLPHP